MTKTIFIDAGHGGKDPGAVSGTFIEKDLNLKAALAARNFLSDYNCKVIMSRETDTGTRINTSTANAAKAGADVYAAIHHNAAGGDGCEVFYWHTDPKAKALATELIERFKALGQNSRGIKPSSEKSYNFGVCRINAKNGIPAVLGEFAFVDNATDRKIIDSDEKLKKEGEAYALALINFLGLKKLPKKELQKEPAKAAFAAGQKVRLRNAPLFVSSSAKRPVRNITGEYRLYDGILILNRLRITLSKEFVGRLPISKNVTGWINSADALLQ